MLKNAPTVLCGIKCTYVRIHMTDEFIFALQLEINSFKYAVRSHKIAKSHSHEGLLSSGSCFDFSVMKISISCLKSIKCFNTASTQPADFTMINNITVVWFDFVEEFFDKPVIQCMQSYEVCGFNNLNIFQVQLLPTEILLVNYAVENSVFKKEGGQAETQGSKF